MTGVTTNDNVQIATANEKPKTAEQINLEEAETALNGKDYKIARELLEKLVKLDVKDDDEEATRIKESAILNLGRVFKETKDAKGKQENKDSFFMFF